MQTPKPRNGPSEVPQRTSPATPRSSRVTKTGGHESDSSSSVHTPTKTPPERSPKFVDRRSPRSPVTEKKRPSRISELESQITQLQEDLKKTKDQLSSSEAGKKRAQQDAEEAKKELQDVSAKLDDSQRQLVEFSAAEEDRLQELRKISQERDRAWQSELEATQKQHSVDSAALASALSEIQRSKQQLEDAVKSEAAQAKQSKEAHDELEFLKQDMAETLSTLETLKIQFKTTQKSEAEAQAVVSEAHQQLEMAKTSVEILNSEGLKLRESLSTVTSELEESRTQVNSLEEMVKQLQADKLAEEEGDKSKLLDKSGGGSGESEVEKLRSALEAAKIKYEEELIQNTTQIQSAYEQLERTKTDCGLREAELESVLENMRTEISELKAALVDKESELQKLAAVNKEITETEKAQVKQMDSELEAKLMKSITDIAELKANLMDKETELQNISEENEILKSEIGKKETASRKSYEAVIAELELAKAAEQEVTMRLGHVTEEVDKCSRRAARVAEQLEAAQAMNSEMEAELRRLRVQSDQWRKAAEAAAAVLTTGNHGRLMERSGSLDSDYNTVAGKLMNSPFSDDLDDESPKKKDKNMLKKIGGLWKKSPK